MIRVPADLSVARWTERGCLDGIWSDRRGRHRDSRGSSYLRLARHGRPYNIMVPRLTGQSYPLSGRCHQVHRVTKLTPDSGSSRVPMITVSSYMMSELARKRDRQVKVKGQ